MIKNTVIFASLLTFATASFANGTNNTASNTDSTLEMFKPSTVNAQPEFWGQYIDTQNYPKKDDFKRYYVQFSFGIESDNFESDTEIGNTTISYFGVSKTAWKISMKLKQDITLQNEINEIKAHYLSDKS